MLKTQLQPIQEKWLTQIKRLPFLQGLRQGHLSQTTRDFYVAQDEYYIAHFMAVTEQIKALPATNDEPLDEGDAHLGLNPSPDWVNCAITDESKAYVYFLESGPKNDDVTQLLRTIPCAESYYLLALSMQNQPHAHQYQAWIDYYTSPAYQDAVTHYLATLQELIEARGYPLQANELAIYEKGYQFEFSFWEQCPD